MPHCLTRFDAVRALRAWLLGLSLVGALGAAQAGLFDDEEARKAILDLRAKQAEVQKESLERHAQQTRATQGVVQALDESTAQARRIALQLQAQLDSLRAEIAALRGQNEQLVRELSEQQRRHRDLAVATDERVRKLEPIKVSLDGKEFLAEPSEVREFEAVVASFRKSEFAQTQALTGDFLRRFPSSGYRFAAMSWQGNAQYALRDYRNAITTLRGLVTLAPDHPRAPEALLAIANCQIELKDNVSARRTFDELTKAHPQSEAAAAAKERLARLR